MNNLKKVLALVVSVAMLASFGFVASAADYSDVAYDANYADAVNLLSNLGLIQGYEDGTYRPDNTITRAEVSAVLVRMLGMEDSVEQGATVFTDVPADNWASGYVNVAYAQGIIAGMGDGTFAPNDEVTYEQIVKMIMCALGYEPAAAQSGGYPTGYLYQASKAGLTKGVSGSVGTAASRATVAKLVYNALDIDLMMPKTVSTGINGSEWEIKEGKTVLTEYLELEKIDGIILSTYISNPDYQDGDNQVDVLITKNYAASDVKIDYEVGDIVSFVADGTDAAALLGYTVVAFVGENEDGDDAVFSAAEKAGKNTLSVIDTDLITEITEEKDSDENSKIVLEYSKTDTAKNTSKATIENTITLKSVATPYEYDNVIINGFESKLYDPNFSILKTGEAFEELMDDITFLDNDNDGDFEFVFVTLFQEDGMEFVVDDIDAEDYDITGKEGGESFSFDFDDEDLIYTIIKDGHIVGFDDIEIGDVITILDDSTSVKVKTVYVSSTVVEGTVDEVEGDDTFTISGTEYKVSRNQKNVDATDIAAGDEGIYYINYAGKIAYVDEVNSVTGADYVYIIDADKSEGDFGDTDYLVKAVNAQGGIVVLTIKSKKVKIYKDEKDENDGKEEYTDEAAYGVVESYLAENTRGGIAKIDTNAAGEITKLYFPGAKDFDKNEKYASDNEKEFSEAKLSYGTIGLKTSTIVFNDDSGEEDLEDAITVSTVGSLFTDGSSYNFKAYGEKDFDEADAIVTVDASTSFDAEDPVMVVTRIVRASNDDDDTYKITGIMAEETKTVIVDPDEVDAVVENIEKGDVIMFSVQPSGLVKNVSVLFDESTHTYEGVDKKISATSDDKMVNIGFGEVTKTGKSNSYFELNGNEEPRFAAAAEGCYYTVVEKSATDVLTIKKGSAGSVKESTSKNKYEVFYKTTDDSDDEVTDVVVFVTPLN